MYSEGGNDSKEEIKVNNTGASAKLCKAVSNCGNKSSGASQTEESINKTSSNENKSMEIAVNNIINITLILYNNIINITIG